jgi:hypothetical protein
VAAAVTVSDPTLAKIRSIIALDGTTGQAGEVVINLVNSPDHPLFRSALVSVEGTYTISVETDDTFFLSMRPDGALLVHIGPNTGTTTARFTINKVSGFEYHISPTETRYTFMEHRPTGLSKITLRIRW